MSFKLTIGTEEEAALDLGAATDAVRQRMAETGRQQAQIVGPSYSVDVKVKPDGGIRWTYDFRKRDEQ